MEALVQMPEIKSELKVDEYTPVVGAGMHPPEHQLEGGHGVGGHVGFHHHQHHQSQWVSPAACCRDLKG